MSITADDKRKGYPRQPTTLGEHIRKARIDKNHYQKQAATAIGVSTDCICFWENGRTAPEIRYYPQIIDYIGFNPFPEPDEPIARLEWHKTVNGLSYDGLAQLTKIHPEQLQAWLTGKKTPIARNIERIEKILNQISI